MFVFLDKNKGLQSALGFLEQESKNSKSRRMPKPPVAFPGTRLEEAPRELQPSPGEFHSSGRALCARPGRVQTRYLLCWQVQWKASSSCEAAAQLYLIGTLSTDRELQQQGKSSRLDKYLLTLELHLSVTFCSCCWLYIPPILIYSTGSLAARTATTQQTPPAFPHLGTELGVWRAQRAPPDLQTLCRQQLPASAAAPVWARSPDSSTAAQHVAHRSLQRMGLAVWQLNQNQNN